MQARFKSIDSLRGVAALSVVLYHLVYTFHQEMGYSSYPWLDFKYGFFGVELFFIISGYVIYYTINQSKSVKEFLIKRLIRLYPTYWLCMITTFLIVYFFPLNQLRNSSVKELIWGFTMFQGLFGIKSVDPSYWSLLIELIFYCGIALLAFFKLFKQITIVLFIWILLIAAYHFLYKPPLLGVIFNMRYGSLFIAGICFYKMKVENDSTPFIKLLLILSFILSVLVLTDMGPSLMALSIIFFVFYFVVFIAPDFFNIRLLLFLGKISYPFYLIHQNIGFVILKTLKNYGYSHPTIVFIPIFISILFSWFITLLFDYKINHFLKLQLLK